MIDDTRSVRFNDALTDNSDDRLTVTYGVDDNLHLTDIKMIEYCGKHHESRCGNLIARETAKRGEISRSVLS